MTTMPPTPDYLAAFEGTRTLNDQLRDALVRHQVYVLGFGGYSTNQLLARMDRLDRRVASAVREVMNDATGAVTVGDARRIERVWSRERNGQRDEITALLLVLMQRLYEQEQTYHRDLFDGFSPYRRNLLVPALSASVVAAALLFPAAVRSVGRRGRGIPTRALSASEWIGATFERERRSVSGVVRAAAVNGDDVSAVLRSIFGTSGRRRILGSVLRQTRQGLTAIAKTAMEAISGRARSDFVRANASLFRSDLWVSVLDHRTTPTCRALDGKVFAVGEGPPVPRHIGCRSTRVPLLKALSEGRRVLAPSVESRLLSEWARRNNRANPGVVGSLSRDQQAAFRAYADRRMPQIIGGVPDGLTYSDWLARQPREFVDDVLGPSRSALFRRGGLALDRFVDRDGLSVPLSELARREAAAFRAAGLNPERFS